MILKQKKNKTKQNNNNGLDGSPFKLSRTRKQPRLQDFLSQTRIKASLIPNLDHEIKKIRTRT
jgi:hypothetical protein